MLFIYYYKDQYQAFQVDLREPALKPDNLAIVCEKCKKDVSFKDLYIDPCGKNYCSWNCQRYDDQHVCTPRKCNHCLTRLRQSDFVCRCFKCGVLYCGKNCRESDGHKTQATCSANPLLEMNNLLKMEDNDGIVGLANIGNTCYMNSALQCLLHNPLLKATLSRPDILDLLNLSNPLGTKGELLAETRELFILYWKTNNSSVNPYGFKSSVCKFLPTFEGYAQHDSQEFLSQLLDSTHEDLNIIRTKPYTSAIEGRATDPNEEIGRKCWINFLKRNYSPIIEGFYGQFRSLVTCAHCGNDSLTFDPFQIVSLAIPMRISETFTIFFISEDHRQKAR